jgi:hypothetical protein
MTTSRTLEDRLQSAGHVLRDRPSVVDQVMAEIRKACHDRTPEPPPRKDPRRD